jgi:hypothetical protein
MIFPACKFRAFAGGDMCRNVGTRLPTDTVYVQEERIPQLQGCKNLKFCDLSGPYDELVRGIIGKVLDTAWSKIEFENAKAGSA